LGRINNLKVVIEDGFGYAWIEEEDELRNLDRLTVVK
jgi:hypothetical protein